MSSYRRINVSDSNGAIHVAFVDRRIIDDIGILELGEDLARLVNERPSTTVVLDFTNVEFLSSAGLGKLLILYAAAKKAESRLILTNLKSPIEDVFTHTRLNELFEIKPDAAAALQNL